MNKDEIIQSYEKANSIKELEIARESTLYDYNQLMSYCQAAVKAAFKLKKELLNG